jgi:hypothetical protein
MTSACITSTIEDEIARRGIVLRGRGPERCGPCPICGGTDRFAINSLKGVWHCRGCAKGGDVIELVRHLDGCGYRDAVERLGGEARPLMPAMPKPAPRPASANSARAGELWRASVPIAGTIAEAHLRSRGLDYADPAGAVLRFHPRCPFGPGATHPCMVAVFRTIVGHKPVAIHRTALTPEGRKIDRMTLGVVGGAAIKLSADEDVMTGLHVGEGIETTIAAMMMNFKPAWALGFAGAIRAFPVLSGIAALTVLVDHDQPDARGRQAGHEAARECAERWIAAGREVRSVVPRRLGADMADVVAGGAA